MDAQRPNNSGLAHGLASLGTRAAAATLKPFSGAVEAAAEAGITVERRAVDRLLDSGELERLVDSPQFVALVERVLEGDGAARLVDALFERGMIDRFIDGLGDSAALWRLIDEIAASPSVTAAISQQGLSFADQFGDELRKRSRQADDRVERLARRLTHRRLRDPAPPTPDAEAP